MNKKMPIKLTNGAIMPTRGSEEAAGLDLYATEDTIILGTELRGSKAVQVGKQTIDTYVSIAIPKGFQARIASRSGLGVNQDIIAFPGEIDSDYRGTVKVKLFNLSMHDYHIKKGERIAQLIVQPVALVEPEEVDTLPETKRGTGGLGSTGK